MAFFSRPNLDNIQFKQLDGSELALSGQTQILSTSGLTLSDGNGSNVIITADGANPATDGYVLTYDNASNKIRLALSSVSGGSTIYNGSSPTTCSVGGLPAGTPIVGESLSCIIEQIVSPTLSPICTPNYVTLSITSATNPLEVGTGCVFTTCAIYNQGSVNPVYCGGTSVRTGLPTAYNYTADNGSTCCAVSSSLCNSIALQPHQIQFGCHNISLNVSYSAGQYPLKSDGSIGGMTCCSAGISPTVNIPVCGIYPYFYGSSNTQPIASSTLLTGGTKCVCISSGNVTVNYNVATKYVWLAIPAGNTKTKWYGSNAPTTNTESIPGGLFNSPTAILVNSPNSCWSAISYEFYISNYQTSTVGYSLTFTN